MVRPGNALDLYYYDGETSRKQAFPTTLNTKFVSAFNANLTNGGSSVFTIPPSNGIQDIICSFVLNVATGSANCAIPSAWGYALIRQVSFRYGGSSQYFLTGDQLLNLALMRQPNTQAMTDIVNLGGNGSILSAAGNLFANVVLTLPHSTPSGVGKANPFPTDLLTQQVQITVETYPLSAILTGSGISAAGVTLTSGSFAVQQVALNNQADALARRVDMSVNAYAYPAQFVQQRQSIPLGAAGNVAPTPQSQGGVPVTLTGFRSGEVSKIVFWLTNTSDYSVTGGAAAPMAPFQWYLPASAQLSYAGDVYSRFDSGSSALFNLINDDKSPQVAMTGYNTASTPPGINNLNNSLAQWVVLPFAQTFVDDDSHHVLVHGKPITNGIVNLLVSPPLYNGAVSSNWVLNVSYIYNTTILMSQGSADFVF